MKIEPDIKLDFDDVLIKPKRSEAASRASVDLRRQFRFKYGGYLDMVPIIASNMDSIGTIAMMGALHEHNCITALHKFYKAEEIANIDLIHFITIGIQGYELEKLRKIIELRGENYVRYYINIDVANGYTQNFVHFIKEVRSIVPRNSVIMAGNVATPEMTQELIINGEADIVKVGIGPGSVCTTRLKTGIGYPQLSAIAECADVAHGLKAHICADGGCKNPGDVAKAFGAGADFVMIGGMLAGTEECEGKWTYKKEYKYHPGPPGMEQYDGIDMAGTDTNEKIALAFHGMSSREAMEQHNGGIAEYKAAEGVEIEVPYKGPVSEVIKDILGGLRSACAYVGADNIKHFPRSCTFIRVNRPKEYLYKI